MSLKRSGRSGLGTPRNSPGASHQTGAPLVLCAGGDGTAFEAAHGCIGSKTALGILPCGTGNDFTRMLHLPSKPEEAALALLEGHAQPIDVGYINGHLFLNSCGAGFDAQTVQAAQKAKFLGRGMLPYLYGVFDTLAHYRPREMTIQADDAPPFTQPCLLCIVANGQFIGGGMQIAPCARFDDGCSTSFTSIRCLAAKSFVSCQK